MQVKNDCLCFFTFFVLYDEWELLIFSMRSKSFVQPNYLIYVLLYEYVFYVKPDEGFKYKD